MRRRATIASTTIIALCVLIWWLWPAADRNRPTPTADTTRAAPAPVPPDYSAVPPKLAPELEPFALEESEEDWPMFVSYSVSNFLNSRYTFDATESYSNRGLELVWFEFDFGDGHTESNSVGHTLHTYDYATSNDDEIELDTAVTVWDSAGHSMTKSFAIRFDNTVGKYRAMGIYSVETTPCLVTWKPRRSAWRCAARLRNPHPVDIELTDLRIGFAPGSPEDVVSQPVPAALPRVLAPNQIVDAEMFVDDALVPDSARIIRFELAAARTRDGKRPSIHWAGNIRWEQKRLVATVD